MKPLSETRKENREQFENHCFVVDACRSCSGLGKHIDLQTTSNTRTCERCLGTGNEKEEYYRLKSFLSTAESRLLSAVKEKINSKKIKIPSVFGGAAFRSKKCVVCGVGVMVANTAQIGLCEAHKIEIVGYEVNAALSDLKSFIEEGMKENI